MTDDVLKLFWGIKPSFLRYVKSLPDCLITTQDGARQDSRTGEFIFPLSERKELTNGGYSLEFSGDVRIKAHGGMLLLIFMNPWLTLTDAGTELSVIDLMHWPDTSKREIIGRSLESTGTEFSMRLAEQALETFNNVYPAGEPLAPARIA